jgi:hypothetical protein
MEMMQKRSITFMMGNTPHFLLSMFAKELKSACSFLLHHLMRVYVVEILACVSKGEICVGEL